ncbi:MAG: 3-hydroxyacyl-CoA dehydrogenase family protein [Firmicutes bacterium]|nr:3-hydroxyacyl-CoA dehydrogenase family protein [Bacillota bacterium]
MMAREIKKVFIAGAGTMGCSMGQAFAKCGYETVLYDIFPEALAKAEKLIAINQKTEVLAGNITEEAAAELIGRIRFTGELEDFREADFVVEAVLEKMEVKHDFWSKVSALVAPDVLLTSNTSGLSITKIAEAVVNPERFAGMHWINPPHIIPLIEVIRGEKTSEETARAVYDLCLALGKEPVLVKDAPGFALNRIQAAILRECLYIVDQGIASVEDCDKVMKYALGLRYACLGPMEVVDHGGLDIHYNIASYLYQDLCDAKEPFGLLKEHRDNGNLGVKTGAGFYDYSDGKDKDAIVYRDTMYNKVSKAVFNKK